MQCRSKIFPLTSLQQFSGREESNFQIFKITRAETKILQIKCFCGTYYRNPKTEIDVIPFNNTAENYSRWKSAKGHLPS